MSKAVEEMREKARAEGRKEGREEGRAKGIEEGKNIKAKEGVLNLSADGMAPEKIARMVNVNVASVQEWLSEREVSS